MPFKYHLPGNQLDPSCCCDNNENCCSHWPETIPGILGRVASGVDDWSISGWDSAAISIYTRHYNFTLTQTSDFVREATIPAVSATPYLVDDMDIVAQCFFENGQWGISSSGAPDNGFLVSGHSEFETGLCLAGRTGRPNFLNFSHSFVVSSLGLNFHPLGHTASGCHPAGLGSSILCGRMASMSVGVTGQTAREFDILTRHYNNNQQDGEFFLKTSWSSETETLFEGLDPPDFFTERSADLDFRLSRFDGVGGDTVRLGIFSGQGSVPGFVRANSPGGAAADAWQYIFGSGDSLIPQSQCSATGTLPIHRKRGGLAWEYFWGTIAWSVTYGDI